VALTRKPGDLPDAVVLHPGRVHRVFEGPPVRWGHPSRNDSNRLAGNPGKGASCRCPSLRASRARSFATVDRRVRRRLLEGLALRRTNTLAALLAFTARFAGRLRADPSFVPGCFSWADGPLPLQLWSRV